MLSQLQAAVAEGKADAAAAAENELSALGGRASYQAASELTTARHRTSKWIFSLLTQMRLRPGKGQPPLKVLEVCILSSHVIPAGPACEQRQQVLMTCLSPTTQLHIAALYSRIQECNPTNVV